MSSASDVTLAKLLGFFGYIGARPKKACVSCITYLVPSLESSGSIKNCYCLNSSGATWWGYPDKGPESIVPNDPEDLSHHCLPQTFSSLEGNSESIGLFCDSRSRVSRHPQFGCPKKQFICRPIIIGSLISWNYEKHLHIFSSVVCRSSVIRSRCGLLVEWRAVEES